MAWIYLLIAGIFEICWAAGMKYCDILKPNLSLFFVAFSATASIVFLGLATKTIPIAVAYAVWSGFGIIGVYLYDVYVLKEPITTVNVIFIAVTLVGVIGLKLTSRTL